MGSLLKTGLSFATGGASGIATWVLEHWRLVLVLIIAAVIGISFKVVLHERDTARAQVRADAETIQVLTVQKAALQANVTDLTSEITTQNGSIDALHLAAADAQKRSQEAMQAAAKQHQKDAASIADLQKRGADPSNGGSCDAEISRIRAGL